MRPAAADAAGAAAAVPTTLEPEPEPEPVPVAPVMNPPDNFAMVAPGVYRGSFPNKKSLPFMERLNLSSILYLCPEDPPEYYVSFMKKNSIKLLHHGMQGNKEPFVEIPEPAVARALQDLVDPSKHPVYIHCDKGKSRSPGRDRPFL